MPRLPDYTSLGGSRAPRPSGAVPSADLTQASRAAADLGENVAGFAERLQRRNDTEAVSEAMTKFQDAEREKLIAEENAVLRRQGENAKGVADEVGQWWEATSQDYEANLQNNDQKRAFRDWLSRRRDTVLDRVARHEVTERERAFAGALEARVRSSAEQAAAFYTDPEALSQSREEMRDAISTLAEHNGWAKEQTDQKMADATTLLHKSVIEASIDSSPEYAKNYYEQHKSEINATDRDEIEEALSTANSRALAQSHADRIMGSAGTMDQALAQAREITDADMRDSVVSRVKTRFGEREAIRREQQRRLSEQAMGMVDEGKSPDEIPTSVWGKLDANARHAVEARYAQLTQGQNIQTNWDVYSRLSRAATDPDMQGEFAQMNLYEFRDQLADAEFKQVLGWQRTVSEEISGGEIPESEIPYLSTKNQMVTRQLVEIGLDPNTDDSEEGRRVNDFWQSVQTAEAEFIQRNNRKPAPDEFQKILDRLSLFGEVEIGMIYFPDKYNFEVTDEERADFVLTDIPEEDANATADMLDEMGFEPTDEAIKTVYTIQKTQGIPRADRRAIESALKRAGQEVTDQNVMRLYLKANFGERLSSGGPAANGPMTGGSVVAP